MIPRSTVIAGRPLTTISTGSWTGQAGLRLAERYAGWDRRPFTSASDGHVSVYQR